MPAVRAEKVIVNKHLTQADVEIEKSRQEMTSMKEAASLSFLGGEQSTVVSRTPRVIREVIDDKSLTVALDDSQPAVPKPLDTDGQPLQQRPA